MNDNSDRPWIIIAGSRSIVDHQVVVKAVRMSRFKIGRLISGGAQGVDQLAEQWATDRRIPITRVLPDWKLYGKRAGSVRNYQMAQMANGLIAIWDGKSPGTRDMIRRAEVARIKIFIFQPKSDDFEWPTEWPFPS